VGIGKKVGGREGEGEGEGELVLLVVVVVVAVVVVVVVGGGAEKVCVFETPAAFEEEEEGEVEGEAATGGIEDGEAEAVLGEKRKTEVSAATLSVVV
jgi:hypothetical protein